jgi:hypothetical protein
MPSAVTVARTALTDLTDRTDLDGSAGPGLTSGWLGSPAR